MFTPNEDKLLSSGPIWQGAALGWHDDLHSKVTSIPSNHDRFAAIKLKLAESSLFLASFYAPTAGHDDDFLESIFYLSEFISQNYTTNDTVIIGTDANCSEKSSSRRKASWNNFCQNLNLKVHSTGQPTFHHNNVSSESCVDLFVTSGPLVITNLTLHCTLETPLNLSSHDPITASVRVQDSSETYQMKIF